MKKTLSIDIISSCVCRDALELGDKATKNNNYKVEFFYQATSPFSLYSQPCKELQSLTAEELVFGSPWQRRIFLSDVTKDMFKKIGSGKRNNYLIMDFSDFSKSLYQLASEEPSYLIKTDPSRNNLEVFERFVERTIDPQILSRKYVKACLDRYVDDILKIYDANKIIICEVYHVKNYVSQDKTIKQFISPTQRLNSFAEECYEYVIDAISKRADGLHLIKMPKGVLGDEAHKWGKYTLHYCNEFYEYLFASIDVACSGYEKEEEEKILDSLRRKCEEQFDMIRMGSQLVSELAAKEEEEQSASKRLERMIYENERLKLENKELLVEIEGIRASKTYKIGRLLTFIPRKLRRGKR